MDNLLDVTPVINFFMIALLFAWLRRERRRRRKAEGRCTRDRTELRAVAEDATNEATTCRAVLERLRADDLEPRTRLRAVRDDRNGRTSWEWN